MSYAKVVGIGAAAKQYEKHSSVALPKSYIKLRDATKFKIAEHLRSLFDSVDDTLFELSEKAGSNREQSLYFDAMRDIRLKRNQVASVCVQEIVKSFNSIGDKKEAEESQLDFDEDDLSLLQHDELEESVAIDNMVNRLSSQCKQELEHLCLRVDDLLSFCEVDLENLPATPSVLCASYAKACEHLSVDIKVKLVLLKLFEKYVLAQMKTIYAELNQNLVKEGILPDLKRSKKLRSRNVQAARQRRAAVLDGDTGEVLSTQSRFVDDLRALLHRSSGYGSDVSDMDHVDWCSQGQAMALLSDVQHLDETLELQSLRSGGTSLKQWVSNQIRTQISENGRLSRDDDDMLELVSLLFEFILGDENLPSEMKALLSRLQIPILKVALLDKGFFNKSRHPARQLLNDMAHAALSWYPKQEGEKDPLKEKIQEIVSTINEQFEADLALFEELQQSFHAFIDAELRRGQLVEQRTTDSEHGKAISVKAHQTVGVMINEWCANRRVSSHMKAFITEACMPKLVLDYLRMGEESDEFKSDCVLIQDMIWSIDPDPIDSASRTKLLSMIPRLIKGLRSSFDAANINSLRIDEWMRSLEDEHVNAIQRIDRALQHQSELNAKTQEVSRSDDEMIADLDSDVQEMMAEMPDIEEPECVGEEIVLVDVGEVIPLEEQIAEDDPFLEQTLALATGTWFEWNKGEETIRCKLAAVIKETNSYIFVSRSGVKVAQKSRNGVAVELRRGSLRVLNDGLLFDRALESIIGNLRERAPS